MKRGWLQFLICSIFGLIQVLGLASRAYSLNICRVAGDFNAYSIAFTSAVVAHNELIDNLEKLGIKCIVENTTNVLFVDKVHLGSAAFYNPIVISDKKVVLRGHSVRLATVPHSMVIGGVYQDILVCTYVPIDATHIGFTTEDKQFNQDGLPIRTVNLRGELILKAPFRPMRKQGGSDCYSMFCGYLTNHGLKELIPDPVPEHGCWDDEPK